MHMMANKANDYLTPHALACLAKDCKDKKIQEHWKHIAGLLPDEEACSAFSHVTACLLAKSPEATLSVEGFNDFVTSILAPTATGWNDSCRAGFTPAEDARLCTAHN
jgi:hypothetical protein